MKKSIVLACAVLCAGLSGTAALAQTQLQATFSARVAAYNEVAADHNALRFDLDPASGRTAATQHGTVAYASNSRTGRTLTLEVQGDLSDMELTVEPLDVVVRDILGVGTPGVATPLVFDAPGAQRLVAGIKQVDAELQVRYRLEAKTPEATGTRALHVVYTITE